jgi:hypothetical protein
MLPNTACTRRVGVAAFSSRFLGSSWFRQNGVLASRPPASNASRWAAHFLSEGDAAQTQIERIQQAKVAKQTIHQGVINDNR